MVASLVQQYTMCGMPGMKIIFGGHNANIEFTRVRLIQVVRERIHMYRGTKILGLVVVTVRVA